MGELSRRLLLTAAALGLLAGTPVRAAETTLKYADNNRESCNISVPMLNQVEGYHREAVKAHDNACAGRPLRPFPADIFQR